MQDGQIPVDAVLEEMRKILGAKDQEIAILRVTINQLSSALQGMVNDKEMTTANS